MAEWCPTRCALGPGKTYFDVLFHEAMAGHDRERALRRVVLDRDAELGAFVDSNTCAASCSTWHRGASLGLRFWTAGAAGGS